MRLIFALTLFCLPVIAQAVTRTAASTSQTDVQTQVTASAPGDTVIIPSGSSTWSGTITLTRGIIIEGSGVANTILTKGSGAFFSISPSTTAISNEETFKITDITFDGNNTSLVLISVTGAGASSTKPFKNLVIGDCKFRNTGTTTSNMGTISGIGQIRGVIYGNTFDRCNVILKILGNDDAADWTNSAYVPFTYGSSDNLFFEDNTILFSSSYGGDDPGWTETGQGSRLVCRYNSWNMSNASQQELWDIHGFQGGWPSSGQTGTMISEYYGNTASNCDGYRWINHRGSWGLYFNNIITGTGVMDIDMSQMGVGSTTPNGCDNNTGITGGQVNNTYVWNNTDDGTVRNMGIGQSGSVCGISENNGYWNYNSSFNGTSGIGRGTTAPSGNCTTGVAYWQASTATPTTSSSVIQAGVLWKATATNTWTSYYTPYTYPHPMSAVAVPSLVSSVIDSAGTRITRTFSESVVTGTGDDAGWSISMSGGAVTGTYESGTGTSTIVYTLSRTVNVGETGTTSYTQPGNGVEDVGGDDLATLSSATITNNSAAGQVAIPIISLTGGLYFGTQNISISTATSGASLYYTTDGSTPDATDTLYTGTLSLSSGLTLRAIGIKSGSLDSAITSETYEINSWSSSGSILETFAVPQQTTTLTWSFDVTPSVGNAYTVLSIGPNPVVETTDMAISLWLTDTGVFQSRNGGGYAAVNVIPYSAATTYRISVTGNISTRTYSATVTPEGGSPSVLATNYAFRTEQAAATELDNVGLYTINGTTIVDNMSFSADTTTINCNTINVTTLRIGP